MRTFVWVMSIMMLTAIFPEIAETNEQNPGNHPQRVETTIQKLSTGQAITFISGSVLGGLIGNTLFLWGFIGRFANTPDRIAIIVMGVALGAIFAGQWCDNGWWPC